MLLEDQPAKISLAEFSALCDEHLTPELATAAAEITALAGAVASDNSNQPRQASHHPFVEAFRDCETELRNAIASERAKRRGSASRIEPRETSSCDASIVQAVAAAFAAKDPLSRELALDAIRWRSLTGLQGISPFSEATILSYAGKLALNSRRFSISDESGMQRFKTLTATARQ